MHNGRSQLPGLGRVSAMFREKFHLENGLAFTGQLSPPRNRTSSDFTDPRRVLYVGPKSVVKAGDVMKTLTDARYLIMNNGEAEHNQNLQYKTFKLVPVYEQRSWKRESASVDPHSFRSRPNTMVELGNPWVYIEPMRDFEDTLRVQTPRERVVTNVELKVGDLLGQQVVKTVAMRLGVYVAEIS